MITIVPLSPALGAEVRGLDLRHLSDRYTEIVLRAFRAFDLLLFRDQELDDAEQIRVARLFGRISRQGAIQKASSGTTYVSNTRSDGTFGEGELLFHSDQCYYDHPMKAIMLYGIEVAQNGGETLFASTSRAYARMPEDLKRKVERASVRHHFDYGALHYGDAKRSEIEALKISAVHRVVSRHPQSGVPILMVNAQTVDRIMDLAPAESATLIDEINVCIAAPDNVYSHKWRQRDLIVWDNLSLQHARSAFCAVEPRTLRRCAIAHDQEPQS